MKVEQDIVDARSNRSIRQSIDGDINEARQRAARVAGAEDVAQSVRQSTLRLGSHRATGIAGIIGLVIVMLVLLFLS